MLIFWGVVYLIVFTIAKILRQTVFKNRTPSRVAIWSLGIVMFFVSIAILVTIPSLLGKSHTFNPNPKTAPVPNEIGGSFAFAILFCYLLLKRCKKQKGTTDEDAI